MHKYRITMHDGSQYHAESDYNLDDLRYYQMEDYQTLILKDPDLNLKRLFNIKYIASILELSEEE